MKASAAVKSLKDSSGKELYAYCRASPNHSDYVHVVKADAILMLRLLEDDEIDFRLDEETGGFLLG